MPRVTVYNSVHQSLPRLIYKHSLKVDFVVFVLKGEMHFCVLKFVFFNSPPFLPPSFPPSLCLSIRVYIRVSMSYSLNSLLSSFMCL